MGWEQTCRGWGREGCKIASCRMRHGDCGICVTARLVPVGWKGRGEDVYRGCGKDARLRGVADGGCFVAHFAPQMGLNCTALDVTWDLMIQMPNIPTPACQINYDLLVDVIAEIIARHKRDGAAAFMKDWQQVRSCHSHTRDQTFRQGHADSFHLSSNSTRSPQATQPPLSSSASTHPPPPPTHPTSGLRLRPRRHQRRRRHPGLPARRPGDRPPAAPAAGQRQGAGRGGRPRRAAGAAAARLAVQRRPVQGVCQAAAGLLQGAGVALKGGRE